MHRIRVDCSLLKAKNIGFRTVNRYDSFCHGTRVISKCSEFVITKIVRAWGGDGGNGLCSYKKHAAHILSGPGIPSGGRGGKGGDVILRVGNCTCLRKTPGFAFAGKGLDGKKHSQKGKDGNDVIIEVPNGTRAWSLEGLCIDKFGRIIRSPEFQSFQSEQMSLHHPQKLCHGDTPKTLSTLIDQNSDASSKITNTMWDINICDELPVWGEPETYIGKDLQDIKNSARGNGNWIFGVTKRFLGVLQSQPDADRNGQWGERDGRIRLSNHVSGVRLPEGFNKNMKNCNQLSSSYGSNNENLSCLKTLGNFYELIICKGGHGGDGNTLLNPYDSSLGQKGEQMVLFLELMNAGDIAFVGFPNAGKSSLLAALTKATPLCAPYFFTTRSPQIGHMKFPNDKSLTVVDLPGIFEGSSGVGCNRNTTFGISDSVKLVVERVRAIAFVIDISGTSSTDNYFENYNEENSSASIDHTPFELPESRFSKKYDEKTISIPSDPFIAFKTLYEEIYHYRGVCMRKPFLVVANKCDVDIDSSLRKADAFFIRVKRFFELQAKSGDTAVPKQHVSVIACSALQKWGLQTLAKALHSLIDRSLEFSSSS